MKRQILIFAAILAYGTWPPAIFGADTPTPPVEARLTVSNPTPFIKETFVITLEIISRDIDIDSRLDLANLPDRDAMQVLGSFEALAVQRERTDTEEITRRRYRAQARLLKPGEISLSPVLQLTSRRRVRSFFGSTVEVRPVTLRVSAIKLDAQPLPNPPEDFSGIIGEFQIEVQADPLEIQAGDLVTVTTTLRGQGWFEESSIPAISSSPLLRAYRLRRADADTGTRRAVFNQTVVPMDPALSALPPITVTWFNTKTGNYQQDVFGPFPLVYKIDTDEDAWEIATDAAPVVTPQRFRRRNVVLPDQTRVHIAPATTSKVIFSIAPSETVRIIGAHSDWVLMEHSNNRGWIPAAALIAP